MEIATRRHRAHRAGGHEHRAHVAETASRRAWHEARARGQRERFQRVAACGTESLALVCSSCGEERRRGPKLCRSHLLCLRCRRERAELYRQRFAEGRRRGRRRARDEGLFRSSAPGGRWAERFITLTVPHSGDPADDAREATRRAWPRFLRLLRDYWRRELERDTSPGRARYLVSECVRYLRSLEATPGTDEAGHAHLHVYVLSPYVPWVIVAHLWARALSHPYRERAPEVDVGELLEATPDGRRRPMSDAQRARIRAELVTRRGPHGRPLEKMRRPVVDVRACRKGIEGEIVKYMTKDARWAHDGRLAYADPDLYGRLYAAMDGRRSVVASRGWLRRHRLEDCPCCGTRHVHIVPTTEDETAEARAARRLADLARVGDFERRLSGNVRSAADAVAAAIWSPS